ncbi:MAG TPA: hypothetical protein VH351_11910 [Bryobacteraceae bacterium]|jgi:hypothetical protein|nr:hypothetical protein [Bryobacteraceae bacterium]
MAYHITLVTNNSSSSIALTNPAYEADSRLVGPNRPYVPERPILVNTMGGNPRYLDAIGTAVNIYSNTDNYCFWDNTNSAINGIGEKGSPLGFNMSAGNLQITINADGTLAFAQANSSAKAG